MAAASSSRKFKLEDAHSYDGLVDSFESLTSRFTLPIAQCLVGMAGGLAGKTVLDVGCGTGVLVLAAAAAQPAPARVFGLDLSEEMLALAERRARDAGLAARVSLDHGDAEALSYGDGTFDVVLSLYALRHLPDPASAVREMFRVVRPGGRIVVGVGSGPPLLSTGFMRAALRRAGDTLDSMRGRQILQAPAMLDALIEAEWGPATGADEAAWTHGVHEYSSSVAQMMRVAGCEALQSHWVGSDASIGSADDFWVLQSTLSSMARKRLASAGPEQVTALRTRFDERCHCVLRNGGRMVYRSGALITSGNRPTHA